jgi:hypothetical protein
MPPLGFEAAISVLERAKTVHALGRDPMCRHCFDRLPEPSLRSSVAAFAGSMFPRSSLRGGRSRRTRGRVVNLVNGRKSQHGIISIHFVAAVKLIAYYSRETARRLKPENFFRKPVIRNGIFRLFCACFCLRASIAESVRRLAAGWTAEGSEFTHLIGCGTRDLPACSTVRRLLRCPGRESRLERRAIAGA